MLALSLLATSFVLVFFLSGALYAGGLKKGMCLWFYKRGYSCGECRFCKESADRVVARWNMEKGPSAEDTKMRMFRAGCRISKTITLSDVIAAAKKEIK